MSFNGSGTYVPPAGQPVATGTVIQSATFNTLVTDIGNTFNNVLPRDGQASMSGQLKLIDGTSSVPGIAFNSEASSGIFRPASGMLALVASGVENLRINSAGRVLIGTTSDDGTNKLQINGPTKVTGALTATSFVGPLTGAVTGNVTGNLTGFKNVDNTNEMTLANGFTGGQLTMNYRGASGAITQVNVGNGIAASGVLAKIVALNIDASGNTTGNAATATNVAWTGVTGKPTTVAGYGITDTYTKAQTDAADALKANVASPTFTGIVNMGGGALELGTQGVAGSPFIDFHSSGPGSDYDVRIGATGGSGTPGQGTLSVLAAGLDLTGAGNVTVATKAQGNNSTSAASTAYVDTGLATKATMVAALNNYVWNAATLPVSYPAGIQSSFVQGVDGWPNYGSVMTMRTFSGGGGSLQMYVPYSPTNGGGNMKVRFGNFDVNSGNSWTGWKTLLADDSPANITYNTFGNIMNLINTSGSGVQINMLGNGTNPSKTLRVTGGNFEIVNSAYSAVIMSLTDAGALAAVTVTQTSDDRKKENWKPLTNTQLDALADMKLAGTFDWIDGTGPSVGGSAQEIRAIVPEAIMEAKDGSLSVNYGGLNFAILQAMLRREKGAV
jgi:hypothetical protein